MIAVLNSDQEPDALNFSLADHSNTRYTLHALAGDAGLLLSFPGSIWELESVRRIRQMQRNAYALSMVGLSAAFILPNPVFDLYSYTLHMPQATLYPLLADPDESAHRRIGVSCGMTVHLVGHRIMDVWTAERMAEFLHHLARN